VTTPSGCTAWASVDDIPTSAVGLHSRKEWEGYLNLATDILWSATQRRWRGSGRTAEVVLRGAPPNPGEPGWPYSKSWGCCPCFEGYAVSGFLWSRGIRDHHEPVAIRLCHPDVTSVTMVAIDEVPFSDWRLDGSWLARTDGCGWSVCRDRTTVSYTYGIDPPESGRLACVELAVEFGRSSTDEPDQACRLPQRVQAVTRQGLTYEAVDDLGFLEKGLTGIPSIDMFITAVNPYGRKTQATVWSPDLMRSRRT
jgi:hypothetical protein